MKQFKETPNVRNLRRLVLSVKNTGQEIAERKIQTSTDSAGVFMQIHAHEGNDLQEFFYVIFLNRANRTTGYILLSMGGMTGTVADPRCIMAAALLAGATSIVLCHNHPSSNVNPSRSDEELTRQIKEAGKYHDIRVLDHIILSDNTQNFYSFADEGIL